MSGSGRKPIRIGVVGCGEIAQLMHLPLLHELPEFKIGGLCDLSASTVDHVAARYGVEVRTTDSQELVTSDEVDAILVCTHDHATVAAAAIAAGKHLLIEKPLAFTLDEGRTLVNAACDAEIVALLGYMKLYDLAVERAISRITRMKDVFSIHVHNFAGRFDRYGTLYNQFRPVDVPKAELARSRREIQTRIRAALGESHAGYAELYSLLLGLGSHDLAVSRVLFGPPRRIIHAQARADNQLLAIFESERGIPCTFELRYGTAYEWWDEWVAVYGRQEELRVEFPNPYIRYAPTVLRIREPHQRSAAERLVQVSHDSPFRREWLHFAQCIRDDVAPRTPLSDGLSDLELSTEIIRALPPRNGSGQ
jgi:predicted dehydrogenase